MRVLGYLLSAILFEIVLHLLWRYIDPNEYIEVYSQKYSSYFDNVYIRGCKASTVFNALEFTSDGILALIFLYCSYSARNCANEFNDSLSLFLTAIIVNIFFYYL